MKRILLCVLLYSAAGTRSSEAPAAFDGVSNGLVDQPTHEADAKAFNGVEEIADGLGPIFNAQSCRECHQSPTSGAAARSPSCVPDTATAAAIS